MPHLARKRMRVLGKVYTPQGPPVPLDTFSPKLQQQMLSQRRVIFKDEIEQGGRTTTAGEGSTVVKTTCGDFGGLTAAGNPCGMVSAGRCYRHPEITN